MDMAATFAGLLVGAVQTQHGGALQRLSLEIGTEVEGEGVVEGPVVRGRQLKQIVVVREGEETHLEIGGDLAAAHGYNQI